MSSFPREELSDLVLLSLTAGSADSAGYIGLGHVFTSNNTGNVVLMGIDLGQGHFQHAGYSCFVLGTFVTGVGLAAWATRNVAPEAWTPIIARLIGLEALLLCAFAICWNCVHHGPAAPRWLVTLLALAMGLQSFTMYRLKVPGVRTTAITGTITNFISGLIKLREEPSARGQVEFQGLVILFYLLGAVVSGFLMSRSPGVVGYFPAALVLFVALRHYRSLNAS